LAFDSRETIEARGKKVFVPFRWIAWTDDAMDVEITKLPLTIFRGARFEDGTISIGHNNLPDHSDAGEGVRSWEAIYWKLAEAGAVVTGPVRSGSGDNEGFCMESSYPRAPHLKSASCSVLRGKWRADFRGGREDLKLFFEIIQRMN
jgi:hypothetical protein